MTILLTNSLYIRCQSILIIMYIPPSSPLNLNATLIDPDTLSESSIGMIAVKIYAFGGLAFMMGIVLYSLGLWVWTVVIKKEWANSPPELELHPEVSSFLCFSFSFLFRRFLADEGKGACSSGTSQMQEGRKVTKKARKQSRAQVYPPTYTI